MKRFTFASVIALPLLLLTSVGANAQGSQTVNAQRAFKWLECTQQQSTGQVGPSSDNPIARSAELVIGLAAAGEDPSAFKHSGVSVADYLKAAVSADVGTNGILLMARALEPSTGSTAPIVAQLAATRSSAGEYGGDIFSDAWAILGLHAAQQSIDADAVRFLRSKQDADQGWSFDNAQSGSDSNTTSLVLQALIAAGVSPDDSAITSGLDYLKTQFKNGGFVFSTQYGTTPDAQSDELAIGSLLATNQAESSYLRSALDNLAGLQLTSGPDTGALSGIDKVMATTPAAGAFLLQPLTATRARQTRLELLPCTVEVAASTTAPAPPALPAARLAQTGGAEGLRLSALVPALALLLAGFGLLRRRSN